MRYIPSKLASGTLIVILSGVPAQGCGRDVQVTGPVGSDTQTGGSGGPAGSVANSGGAGSAASRGKPGSAGMRGGAGSSATAGGMGGSAGGSGSSAGSGLVGSIEQAGVVEASAIGDIEVLAESLNEIAVPAVGSDGVSLLQYAGAGWAAVLYADWNAVNTWWHESVQAAHLFTAAHGARHIALLWSASYGIYADGAATEISGSPSTYKEFLAANQDGFAWVDYPGSARPNGQIVFRSWNASSQTLDDTLRYRAHLDLSATHVVFVGYASTEAGTVGQVTVQSVAGGTASSVAPSVNHQDRPAIDGNWVVWEEYLNDTDAVIRACDISTHEVRDLSATSGFRTNADVHGTRVIWEDQRDGDGDIRYIDLEAGEESIAVSGPGHSAAPQFTADGLVWIESSGGNIGLLRARWVR